MGTLFVTRTDATSVSKLQTIVDVCSANGQVRLAGELQVQKTGAGCIKATHALTHESPTLRQSLAQRSRS